MNIIVKSLIFALMGGYATFLSNKMIAVYHDGLRPITPEFMNGNMSRSELAAITFSISIGFITGFALPITIASGVIVIHIILLTADIIGVSIKNTWLAILVGAAWGGLVPIALDGIVKVFEMLPVNFLDVLADVGEPIVYAFMAFPAIAVAMQFGKKQGIITFAISIAARTIIEWLNPLTVVGVQIELSPDGIAMLVGMFVFIVYAASSKNRTEGLDDSLFENNVKRIKSNVKYIAPMGGIIALAASYYWIASEPIAASLIGKGEFTSAAIVAFIQSIGFIPLIITTSLVSGVYATNGWDGWLMAIGYASPNPIIAFFGGIVAMIFEVFSLDKIGSKMNEYQEFKLAGDNIRTAMTQILEVALLVGGVNAGNAIWPGAGLYIVVALYILNEVSGRPIMRMATAPLAAIVVGVLANLLAVIGVIF